MWDGLVPLQWQETRPHRSLQWKKYSYLTYPVPVALSSLGFLSLTYGMHIYTRNCPRFVTLRLNFFLAEESEEDSKDGDSQDGEEDAEDKENGEEEEEAADGEEGKDDSIQVCTVYD